MGRTTTAHATSTSVRELFVLGMISRRPMYGHEIMRTLAISRAEMWVEIGDKHVYHVLRKLERQGLVRGAEERVAGRPARRRFAITPSGRLALAAMFEDEAHQRAVAYSPFDTVVAMLAWGKAPGSLALRLLRQRRAVLATRLRREHPAAFCAEVEARFGRVPRAMFVKARLLLEAELRWLDDLIAETVRVGWKVMRIRDVPVGRRGNGAAGAWAAQQE
jgi:DNA-binding PadR family transcriptional regulator